MTNAGLLYDNISNADGGGNWISGLFQLAGDAVKGGFAYGANKDTANALKEQARLEGLSAQIQAGYGALGQDTGTELLAAALGNRYNQPTQPPAKPVDPNKFIWLALVAAVAVVAIVFINKQPK